MEGVEEPVNSAVPDGEENNSIIYFGTLRLSRSPSILSSSYCAACISTRYSIRPWICLRAFFGEKVRLALGPAGSQTRGIDSFLGKGHATRDERRCQPP